MELSEPEDIIGWMGRQRVKGLIMLEYYDSKGRSFNSMMAHFEVIVETDDKGQSKVIDFTPL
jgi:hypothetical protein